ncbi:hypothetical protein PC121_g14487 [Phytophthora cactorum]|nr:hypothetical protein PC120_g18248 [Phytophthora cactorum]KAG3058235.1 hypothetical protein PC121_g14487 [Phytophthora cactorum]
MFRLLKVACCYGQEDYKPGQRGSEVLCELYGPPTRRRPKTRNMVGIQGTVQRGGYNLRGQRNRASVDRPAIRGSKEKQRLRRQNKGIDGKDGDESERDDENSDDGNKSARIGRSKKAPSTSERAAHQAPALSGTGVVGVAPTIGTVNAMAAAQQQAAPTGAHAARDGDGQAGQLPCVDMTIITAALQ